MKSSAKPTDIINQFYDEMLKRNYDFALDIADPAYKSLTERTEVNPETLRKSCMDITEQMETVEREVLYQFNDGDTGVVLHRYTGTFKETGEPFSLRSADFYRIKDGKLLEHWGALQYED